MIKEFIWIATNIFALIGIFVVACGIYYHFYPSEPVLVHMDINDPNMPNHFRDALLKKMKENKK